MPLANRPPQEPQYTPDEDVTVTLEDGRQIQAAVKGTPIPMSDAIALGLVKEKDAAKEAAKTDAAATGQAPTGPSETKPATGPTEKK